MTTPEFADALTAASLACSPAKSKTDFLRRLRARLDADAPGWREVYDPATGERVAKVELQLVLDGNREVAATLFTHSETVDDDA